MAKNSRYILVDTQSTTYKSVSISVPKLVVAGLLSMVVVVAALKFSADWMLDLTQNSKIYQLQKENAILEKKLADMSQKLDQFKSVIDEIAELDDQIRQRLDIPEISDDVRKVGVGGSDMPNQAPLGLLDERTESRLLAEISRLGQLERELKLEHSSFNSLLTILDKKEDSLRYLPAINPVPEGYLTDRFGKRKHPILKRVLPHHGIDIGAKRGTPIFATADGVVTFTGQNGGYGLFVVIDHRYGYVTKYGHLQKIYVRKGQYVKRGDKIGEVGNTGLSTAPHLHYEVHYRGKALDPLQFYFPDISYTN
ncbi:MAG: M23 family metallopeptidase [Calditrichia bacterium]